jgi:hypothetical protein
LKIYYYIASAGVLAVKTNIKNFNWSYGNNIPEGTEDHYKQCAVKLQVELKEFNDDAEHAAMGKYHFSVVHRVQIKSTILAITPVKDVCAFGQKTC